nr:hypothetical protein [Sphingomonas sp. TF3]
MPLADRAQCHDEANRSVWNIRLIRVDDHARIKQGGRLERIFVAEIGADQKRLIRPNSRRIDAEAATPIDDIVEASHEHSVDIAMPFVERFRDFPPLPSNLLTTKGHDAINDPLRSRHARDCESTRVTWHERPYNSAGWIGP